MLIVVPAVFFILVFLVCRKTDIFAGWRDSLLATFLIAGLTVTALTEFLNLFNGITFGGVLSAWSACCLIAIICLIKIPNKAPAVQFRSLFADLAILDKVLLAGIGLIIVMTGLIAVISPTNNWDSMTYHMSRVVNWEQNENVSSYPTSNIRQLFQCPWVEFSILHLQILSGSDQFANMIQWLSMVGSIVGVSLLAGQFGAGTRGQIIASAACAAIPMGIL